MAILISSTSNTRQSLKTMHSCPRINAGTRSFFFSSRSRNTISLCDWSSDVCSSDLGEAPAPVPGPLTMSQPPGPPRFVTLPEIRRAARERLPREVWNFGDGGAETETTLRRNRRRSEERRVGKDCIYARVDSHELITK